MSSMSTNWESLPQEIWLSIFAKLPLKNQVSLACCSKHLYTLSLDHTLPNKAIRIQIYWEKNDPLPPLLAKSIRVLKIDRSPKSPQQDFLLKELLRMENLTRLIVASDLLEWTFLYSPLMTTLLACKKLEEVRAADIYLRVASVMGKHLLHFAAAAGNEKVARLFLSQIEYHHYLQEKPLLRFNQSELINQKDLQSKLTPLQIAIKQGNIKMISLLLRKGGMTSAYVLDEKTPLNPTTVSSFLHDPSDYGCHLDVEFLEEKNFSLFFNALAENPHLFSLRFSAAFFTSLQDPSKKGEPRKAFFQELVKALLKNQVLLGLDLSADTNPSSQESIEQEIKPLLQCKRLKELWLAPSLIGFADASKKTLLHAAVLADNKNLAKSFIYQGAVLSKKDSQGRTPYQLAKEFSPHTENQELVSFLKKAQEKKLSKAFGKKEWEKYYGPIGSEPPLPPNILEILESPCPIWEWQKVEDTHLLVLIPEKVRGKPLTLSYFQWLAQNPKGEHQKLTWQGEWNVGALATLGNKPAGPSHWVLMAKNILPNTTGTFYELQLEEIQKLELHSPAFKEGGYRVPTTLEAIVCLFMLYIRDGIRLSATAEGTFKKRWGQMSCEKFPTPPTGEDEMYQSRYSDRVIIGAFRFDQLAIYHSSVAGSDIGLGVLRPLST